MIKIFEMFAWNGWDINLVSKIFKQMFRKDLNIK